MSKKRKKKLAKKLAEKKRWDEIKKVLAEPTFDDKIRMRIEKNKEKVNTKSFRQKQSFGPAEE